jgi:hypothetical protein
MPRVSDGEKTHLGWWTAALLIALASVLIGLYVAARLLLSLEQEQGSAMFDAGYRAHLWSPHETADPPVRSQPSIGGSRTLTCERAGHCEVG